MKVTRETIEVLTRKHYLKNIFSSQQNTTFVCK